MRAKDWAAFVVGVTLLFAAVFCGATVWMYNNPGFGDPPLSLPVAAAGLVAGGAGTILLLLVSLPVPPVDGGGKIDPCPRSTHTSSTARSASSP